MLHKKLVSQIFEWIRPSFYQPFQVQLFLCSSGLTLLLLCRFLYPPGWWLTFIASSLLFTVHAQLIFLILQPISSDERVKKEVQLYYRSRFRRVKSAYLFFTLVLLVIVLEAFYELNIIPVFRNMFTYYFYLSITAAILSGTLLIYIDYRLAKIRPEESLFGFFRSSKK